MVESPRIIQIKQDNDAHEVRVRRMTPSACAWLGYDGEDVTERPLGVIVDRSLAEDIADEVSYEVGGPDVADVLKKYRELPFVGAGGRKIASHATVSLAGMEGLSPLYNIRLEEADHVTLSRRGSMNKLAVRMHHKAPNILDAETRLPNDESFARDVRLVLQLMDELGAMAYVMMMVPVGVPDVAAAIREAGACAHKAFRATDVVARCSPQALGMVLMDAHEEGAQGPVERLLGLMRPERLVHYWIGGCALLPTDDAGAWAKVGYRLSAAQASGNKMVDLRGEYRRMAQG